MTGSGESTTIERGTLNYTVDLTNNKTEKGTITVDKAVLYNNAPDTQVNGKTVKIGLYSDAEGETKVNEGSITLGANGTGSVVFEELEFGTYYIYEIGDDGKAVTGNSATINGVAYTVTEATKEAELKREQKTANISITNAQNETGSIKVTKTLKYNGEIDTKSAGTKFSVGLSTTKDPETIAATSIKEITVDATGKGEATFSNLTVGGTYYIYEVDAEGKPVGAGYEYTVTGSGTAKTIERGILNYTVDIINNKYGVQVSKVDVADGEELEGATIQIIDKDG